jgi:NAD(P)-dependent dehydrogenase (short-subunit alcohol dehydrogenase family)
VSGDDRRPRALVTGGSSGIGAAVVAALAAAGWSVLAVGRDAGRLDAVASAAGGDVEPVVADLARDAELVRLADRVGPAPLDALVHAAGVIALAPVADVEAADLDAQWRVNLRAPFLLTRALLPALRAAPGDVVFVNSGAGRRANAGWSGYAASKFGLRALADALRAEERAHGVRVTSVYPGRTDTPMQRQVFAAEDRRYDTSGLVPPEAVAAHVLAAIATARPACVPDVEVRPA